jgi:ribose transport system permease protein
MLTEQRGRDRGAVPAPRRRARTLRASILRALSVHGLLLLLIALVVAFSVLRPSTFPTAENARAILNQRSVTALLALAVMVPLAANQFDLSVGYLLGLTSILAIGLQTRTGLPAGVAIAVVLLIGAAVGLVNGLLITRAKIDAFIATLGSGTVLYGISQWYTGGQQVVGNVPAGFTNISATPAGVPLAAVYVLAAGIVLWLVLEFLPQGRYLYVLGANPRAAELTGISARRYVPLAFVASGTLTALAGVLLASQLGVGQSSVGPEYLLPAFAGALLGATSVRPGRVNVWGTILAVLVLAVAVAGLQQLGAKFFVEPLFNGWMLIAAVGLAGFAARRRVERAAVRDG